MSMIASLLVNASRALRAGPLVKRTWFVLLILALTAAAWLVLDFPTFAQAEDATALWSADITVVELENGAIGAIRAGDFSNQGGSARLTAKWLYHYEHDGKLRLSFTEGADVEGYLLQVGDFSVAFTENDSGNNSFTWDDVDVDWEQGDVLPAQIIQLINGNFPPAGLPAITGRPQVNETLTAETSAITDANGTDSATYAYQWQSAGTDVALATNSTYSPSASDVGNTITVKVTFEDDAGNSESVTSSPTGVVLAANTTAAGLPSISGDPKVRNTLSSDVTGISDEDGLTSVRYNYQWSADSTDIEGATGPSYKLTATEMGKTLTVTVAFQDDAGNSETLTSVATGAVGDGPPDPTVITSARRNHVGMLGVDWTDSDGAVSYELQYHQYDLNWLTLPHPALNYEARYNGSSAAVDGLGYQFGYSFRVRAVNDAGNSDWSETYTNGNSLLDLYGPEESDRPRITGAPSRPQDLEVSRGRHLEIGLEWTTPEDSGNSDVTGYRIEFRAPRTRFWNYLAITEETSYNHTGLSPNRVFEYRVSAYNDHGRGQNSDVVKGSSRLHASEGPWRPEVHKIPQDWDLLPEGRDWKHGDRFRLMFITSNSRDAISVNIDDYNTFVREAAAGGHSSIQEYSSSFRVLASTAAIDARDNTGTTWSNENRGVPVYWLEGTKAADDYPDLYDGEWDDPRWRKEVRKTFWRELVPGQGWVTREGSTIYYHFDASLGEYLYTDEHGVSMSNRHCHGYSWRVLDANGNFRVDNQPCIATGSVNDGTAHHFEYSEGCGYYRTLGSSCNSITIGRPTRTNSIDPTLWYNFRENRPAFTTSEVPGNTEWAVKLKNESEGFIAMTFVFYAVSPVFQVEGAPTLTVQDAEATDATLDFMVTLDPAADAEVTVDYATQDGTATAGADYTAASGTLTFTAGDTTQTVSVTILDDTTPDDGETFKLLLSNASGADLGDSEATGTINNTEINNAPDGVPNITGTPRVRETLTAGTSGISDPDGTTTSTFSYQWLADNAEIESATASTYTVQDSDTGKRLSVRVSFTDDAENAESLTSAETEPVTATVPTAPTALAAVTGDDEGELDASWQAPSSNGGSAVTGYKVQWKEAADSWDTAADVSEATVTGTTHTITSLTGGVEYAVRVIATNVAGDGPASTEARATPADSPTSGEEGTETVESDSTAAWTTTLTVGVSGSGSEAVWGYSWFLDGMGTLDGRTYSEGDQTIEVMAILLSNGFVAFNVRPHPRVDFVLTVDGTEFASADASEVKSRTLISYVWATTLDWAEDDRVKLSLTLKDTESAEQSEPAENTPATGLLGISGTPQVDQTLTADTSPIDDADGLTNVSYRYQWIAGGTDIDGATGASFTLTASEQGKTIQVQVTFTDDRGNAESLTSVATEAVAPKPIPLTASFSNMPASHSGSGEFTFDLTFSENFPLSYRTLRDHAFTEDDHGPVTRAQRKVQGSNQTWTITVEPSGNGAITITLPATTDCNATGAICTDDGRKLSNSTSVSVAGPG